MSKTKLFAVAFSLIAIFLVFSIFNANSSEGKLAQEALDRAQACSIQGTRPQIMFAHGVNGDALSSIGFDAKAFSNTVELVILKGDFNPNLCSHFGRNPHPIRAKYLAFILELDTGYITGTVTTPTGQGFGKILNDSSLEAETLPVVIPATMYVPTVSNSTPAP